MDSKPGSFSFNVLRIWALCQQCAQMVYNIPPTAEYARNVALFLIEICAQEGSMRWERQRSPRFDGNVGGFSKWQMETAWIQSAMRTLQNYTALNQRVDNFVFNDPNCPLDWAREISLDAILWAMRMDDNDKLPLALCRVGILSWPESIPATLEERAALWKLRYNTAAGAGRVEEYIANAKNLVYPYIFVGQ